MEGVLDVTRRIRRTMRIWSSLVYERVNIYDIPADRRDDYVEEKGISIKRRFRVALERDTRPNRFVPTSGANTRIDAEYVGGILGGAEDFYKIDASWARYLVISTPTVLATRLRMAWVKSHSNSGYVPRSTDFTSGANSIRGYAENTVGPKDTTDTRGRSGRDVGQYGIAHTNEFKFWFTFSWMRAAFRQLPQGDHGECSPWVWDFSTSRPLARARTMPGALCIPGMPSDRVHLSILFSF
jgi:outer membrane protein assembly factor BamA